ncbi:hypothetical protein [Streptomyces sp. SID5910]|uniref:hypothetical protein n=1 Tax=Streptomyces sp. SID5910 TaxID=2690312 RepID=UPI00136818DE|nr:hypothetical protein [Streptomyces sp. SID5910]MYR46639.1 hypothetical protein [Streptomyces sp. SID5910]
MTTRTDVYLTAVFAAAILVIGLTILVTGVFTTNEVGAVITAGTALTTVGALATVATGYRAARHYATHKTNRATIAALAHAIAAHDAALDAQPPEASTVVSFGGAQARRQPRESTP